MGFWDYFILALIAAAAIAALIIIKKKKGCSCGCESCAARDCCETKK